MENGGTTEGLGWGEEHKQGMDRKRERTRVGVLRNNDIKMAKAWMIY